MSSNPPFDNVSQVVLYQENFRVVFIQLIILLTNFIAFSFQDRRVSTTARASTRRARSLATARRGSLGLAARPT